MLLLAFSCHLQCWWPGLTCCFHISWALVLVWRNCTGSLTQCPNRLCCRPKDKQKATLQAIAGVAALVGLGTLGGVALTLSKGGPAALMAAIAKSGFSAAFALIFVSEIGDKVGFPIPLFHH